MDIAINGSTPRMKTSFQTKVLFFLTGTLLGILIGFVIGWILASEVNATRIDRVVAMSWGDGKYGPAFYGAQVYLVPIDQGYSVRGKIHIGRGNRYYHDCGELGTVKTDKEAVAKWGKIDWQADGLHVGNGANHYFLPREQYENHR